MPAAATPALLTVGEIARRLNEPLHRIEYVIRSRSISAVGRAGVARVFTEADVSHIGSELRRIDEDKGESRT